MLKFGTKAETLEILSTRITSAKILPQIRFKINEWITDSDKILNEINSKNWFEIPLIIRSSSIQEDGFNSSMAGKFESIGNIFGKEEIVEGIILVIKSFGNYDLLDQIFIQPMLSNVSESGVAFTKDPNTGGEYYVINYDSNSGLTDSVTSGRSNDIETYFYHKLSPIKPNEKMCSIINLLRELEEIFQATSLDIEYAVSNEVLYLLQVRTLVLNLSHSSSIDLQKKQLLQIEKKFKELDKPHPYLLGKKSIFGIMPDWNPAEIIGVRPKPLALSLYKEIITNRIWAKQRKKYGYRDVVGVPLLYDFGGIPYIDVRASFNSFIPKKLDISIANKLCNYYINALNENRHNHDKIEFEIVFSCFTFDLHNRVETLKNYNFDDEECDNLLICLKELTYEIIKNKEKTWKNELNNIKKLEKCHHLIINSDMDNINKIYWLIEDCKKYGTLPFAGLARSGFIAVQILKSLVNVNILTLSDYDNYMMTLNTVSSSLKEDFIKLNQEEFLSKYGHLRPGTYDIMSDRYDESPEKYFDWEKKCKYNKLTNKFKLKEEQINQIEQLLDKNNFDITVDELLVFINNAIEGREYSKFIFTKTLSDILFLIKKIGISLNFSAEECSYINIQDVLQMYTSCYFTKDQLKDSIHRGKNQYLKTVQLSLPPIINSSEEIWNFFLQKSNPNFITLKKFRGEPMELTSEINKGQLDNKIIMINSADPGYDWIFSYDIVGLITMYGGLNSHMAIRANELGIPAIIGSGEKLYQYISSSNIVEIDCANKQVKQII